MSSLVVTAQHTPSTITEHRFDPLPKFGVTTSGELWIDDPFTLQPLARFAPGAWKSAVVTPGGSEPAK